MDISKRDLKVLFQSGPKKGKSLSSTYLKFLGLFLGIFGLSFVVVNFSAISKKTDYFWNVELFHRPYRLAQPAPTPAPTFDPSAPAKLLIPKIGVDAPIIWSIEESQIVAKLLEGVVHFQGTALPDSQGNIFIIGHSSYYSWSNSPYKDVFALLEKLDPGDKIYIQANGRNFTYEVQDKKVVSPKEISVMAPTPGKQLTLMTCVPIGTNLNRLIITSAQISP